MGELAPCIEKSLNADVVSGCQNVVTRERMALSTSTDSGVSWRYFATLDNGSDAATHETSDCYPTVIVHGQELLTAWSTYSGHGTSGVAPAIKLARTALPALLAH